MLFNALLCSINQTFGFIGTNLQFLEIRNTRKKMLIKLKTEDVCPTRGNILSKESKKKRNKSPRPLQGLSIINPPSKLRLRNQDGDGKKDTG